MKATVLAAVALALGSGCVSAPRALHYAAIATEVAAEGSLACDAVSTHELLRNPNLMETNAVMGTRPSIGGEAIYFGSIGAGVAGLNEAFAYGAELGRPSTKRRVVADIWRVVANVTMFAIEVDAIQNNRGFGPTCGI